MVTNVELTNKVDEQEEENIFLKARLAQLEKKLYEVDENSRTRFKKK